ncbi:methylated-DNA--[protein]-cysteine S-methyltransferase [Romboutsia sedimentorum]|uniref:Methylated-DNA--[protein]-cysteine S-methyltransferase n=1 Tax=Romboutsia sedimentorum TaxID=1368474 RepID=A0ABT7E6Q5_9FIRM|nr:methylated-DNA--[protein]-cysteine S-methyltransferase [Romboutsia sedimentorum]MDK2562601.1 methylated-DNA--[protein]-cysteine S-methyltransferase [Romboutsia sedimentorum]
MVKIGYDIYDSIIGKLYVVVSDKGVERVLLDKDEFDNYIQKNDIKEDKDICRETIRQLSEYFNQSRKDFDLKINIDTTEFRKSVYNEVIKIPYGQTRSYTDIAKAIQNEKAVRAVGQANRVNNIIIIIPCHRVIGKSGKMVGYAGNKIDIKEKLLRLEERF